MRARIRLVWEVKGVKCPRCGFRGWMPMESPDGVNFYLRCPRCAFKWLWMGEKLRLDRFMRK